MINIDEVVNVSDVPESNTKLFDWRVYIVGGTERTVHFLGNTGEEGRISSPIDIFDVNQRIGVTNSGKTYQLIGASGYSPEAIKNFNKWLGIIGAPDVEDITKEYERL
ncbi:hypothetical protein M0R04_05240 [Candidatus Dojkabacteria bacterium]|jgi:hypothetical protein|nr:hypothetical protein [Candidatus Dojkabacteria bacterium]